MILARSWASGSLSFLMLETAESTDRKLGSFFNLTDVWLKLIASNMRFDLMLMDKRTHNRAPFPHNIYIKFIKIPINSTHI